MEEIMCTKEDVKSMVYEAFDEEEGLRSQIQHDIKTELKLATFQVITAVGITFLVAVISFTIYITTIKNDVERLNGDVFTQQEAALLKSEIDHNSEALENVAQAGDLQRVEETLIRLDERLRNSGI
jgi:hypothetical protein